MHLQLFVSLIFIINPIVTSSTFPYLLKDRTLRYLEPTRVEKKHFDGVQRTGREHKPERAQKMLLAGIQDIVEEHKDHPEALEKAFEKHNNKNGGQNLSDLDLERADTVLKEILFNLIADLKRKRQIYGWNPELAEKRLLEGIMKLKRDYVVSGGPTIPNPERAQKMIIEELLKSLKKYKENLPQQSVTENYNPEFDQKMLVQGLQEIVKENKDRPETLEKAFDKNNNKNGGQNVPDLDLERADKMLRALLMKVIADLKRQRQIYGWNPELAEKRLLEGIQKLQRDYVVNGGPTIPNPERAKKIILEELLKSLKKYQENQLQQSGTDNFNPSNLPLDKWQWMCSFPGCVVPSMGATRPYQSYRRSLKGRQNKL